MRLRVGAKAWRMRKVLIGTSGWTYDGWHGPFYPENLRKNDWLSWYATQFPTAEINGSFYRTPSLDAVRKWRDQTPKNFVFAWKASKFITHWKRLGETCPNSIELMETRLEALSPKLGAVLFQLRRNFLKIAIGWRHSSRCSRAATASRSSFVTRAGTPTTSSVSSTSMTSRFVSPTITMRPPRGKRPRVTSMCAATGQPGATRATTRIGPCAPGRGILP